MIVKNIGNQKGYVSKKRLKYILSVLKKHNVVSGLTPEKLKVIFEELGPTFVKIGQIMSMRNDILPEKYCAELKRLRADVKTMKFSEVKEILESEYGVSIKYLFESIEEKPLGSASMAQVHIATIKTGEKVAIKVQRPYIYDKVAQDINLLKRAVGILKVVGAFIENIDLNMVLEEMWEAMQQEMNFILEASNLKEFYKLNEELKYVTCPKVYSKLSTSKVLVMEYIEGVFIDNTSELKNLGYDLDEIGMKIADNYIKQIIDDGFFHADPHPGNIIIRNGEIVWIDLGIMGRLSVNEKDIISSALASFVSKDSYELKNSILKIGVSKSSINHAKLQEDTENIINKYGSLDLATFNLSDALQDIMDIMRKHNIYMASGISILLKGIITIEGVLSMCSPKVNFIEIIEKHILSNTINNFDIKKEAGTIGRLLYNFVRKGIDIPIQFSDVLKMTLKGQTKVNLDIKGSEEPIKELNKMVDKMIVCIITAALLIGSSLVITTDMDMKILGIPILGFVGYITSVILGGWLLYNILRKK